MISDKLPNSLQNPDEAIILSQLVTYLAHKSPSLESLSPEERKVVAKAVIFDSLKDELKTRVELEKINYEEKKKTFLARHRKRSEKTERTYATAIGLLDSWASRSGIHVLEMKASHADTFIDSLEGSASTIRLRVSGVSSFFSFLERETDGRVRNPFRGTKARPVKKTKAPVVPNEEELELIKKELAPPIQAAVVAMMGHGFRVGAIRTLVIWGGKYTGTSKGKLISGTISPSAIEAIKAAGLDSRKPWASLSEDAIRNAFKYASGKLHRAGKIRAAYSVHDIRHLFGIREYLKDRDIYRLKTLLGHASIQVTENYLRGIEIYWNT